MAEDNGYLTTGKQQEILGKLAKVRHSLVDRYQGMLLQNPHLAEIINQQVEQMMNALDEAGQSNTSGPTDNGLLHLTGLGGDGATQFENVRMPPPLPNYDEEVASERLLGIADLYYIYQHERLGVFRAILKLQELFKAGRVRLASGPGALGLYQFDRQRVLRYTRQERLQAYKRVFGYTDMAPPAGSKPNNAFHGMFMKFNMEVAQFFRDQRVSEVVRPDGRELTFGSVAVVRRAGLDLRNNLKTASYGHVNVLRVEVLQLLEQAFEILGSDDVQRLFGADNSWDALEEVLHRYLGESTVSSQRSRMAVTGRDILRWLAQPDILANGRTEFEALIRVIRDDCEEWLTSAESVGLIGFKPSKKSVSNVIPLKRPMAIA